MIHTISNKISNLLIEKGLPKENQAIYSYGCESFLNLFICNFILVTYSITIGELQDFLVCFLSFTNIYRRFTYAYAFYMYYFQLPFGICMYFIFLSMG